MRGLLWFDDDPRRSVGEKAAAAARRYVEKFGRLPNVCYVHPSMLGGEGDGQALDLEVGVCPLSFRRARTPSPEPSAPPGSPRRGRLPMASVRVPLRLLPTRCRPLTRWGRWKALAECGCDTPPLRRGLQMLAEQYSPGAVYAAVVEALAYGTPSRRLLGYVRRVLERRAADAGEEPESEDAEGLTGQGQLSDRVWDDAPPGPSDGTPEGIWRRALGLLELELTRATFTTWLAGSRCVRWEGDVLRVRVASPQARDWLKARLLGVVERAVARAAGRPVRVQFVVEGEVVDG